MSEILYKWDDFIKPIANDREDIISYGDRDHPEEAGMIHDMTQQLLRLDYSNIIISGPRAMYCDYNCDNDYDEEHILIYGVDDVASKVKSLVRELLTLINRQTFTICRKDNYTHIYCEQIKPFITSMDGQINLYIYHWSYKSIHDALSHYPYHVLEVGFNGKNFICTENAKNAISNNILVDTAYGKSGTHKDRKLLADLYKSGFSYNLTESKKITDLYSDKYFKDGVISYKGITYDGAYRWTVLLDSTSSDYLIPLSSNYIMKSICLTRSLKLVVNNECPEQYNDLLTAFDKIQILTPLINIKNMLTPTSSSCYEVSKIIGLSEDEIDSFRNTAIIKSVEYNKDIDEVFCNLIKPIADELYSRIERDYDILTSQLIIVDNIYMSPLIYQPT